MVTKILKMFHTFNSLEKILIAVMFWTKHFAPYIRYNLGYEVLYRIYIQLPMHSLHVTVYGL